MSAYSTALAEAVVCRPLAEKATANYVRLDQLIDKVGAHLRRVAGFRGVDGITDAAVKALGASALELHDALVITAENPRLDALIKKNSGKIRNFRKALMQYAKAETVDQLRPILKAQQTRSSGAMEKFWEWSRFVLSIVGSADSEVEGSFDAGGFHVVLVTTRSFDWSQDSVARLRRVLESVAGHVQRAGMGHLIRGNVFAYPSSRLPLGAALSHSALASYSPKRDTMNVAAGEVDDDKQGSELTHSIIHELGHRAYFKHIYGNARSSWAEFFEAGKGTPDLADIIKRWEEFAAREKYGSSLSHYMYELTKAGTAQAKSDRMWLELVASHLGIKEALNPYTGAPKGKGASAIEQFKAGGAQARVFLHPVSSYSGKNHEEMFAETFADYVLHGPRKIPEIVRIAFRQAIPGLREADEFIGLSGQLLAAFSAD